MIETRLVVCREGQEHDTRVMCAKNSLKPAHDVLPVFLNFSFREAPIGFATEFQRDPQTLDISFLVHIDDEAESLHIKPDGTGLSFDDYEGSFYANLLEREEFFDEAGLLHARVTSATIQAVSLVPKSSYPKVSSK